MNRPSEIDQDDDWTHKPRRSRGPVSGPRRDESLSQGTPARSRRPVPVGPVRWGRMANVRGGRQGDWLLLRQPRETDRRDMEHAGDRRAAETSRRRSRKCTACALGGRTPGTWSTCPHCGHVRRRRLRDHPQVLQPERLCGSSKDQDFWAAGDDKIVFWKSLR
jgi:hypothetical protein